MCVGVFSGELTEVAASAGGMLQGEACVRACVRGHWEAC